MSFLSKCNYRFVNEFVEENHEYGHIMNTILNILNLKSPGHWEKFTESQLHSDLKNEEAKEELESCVSKCTRKDFKRDFFGKAYEELLEKFESGKTTKKPDYSCPKCVKYLPARHLVQIPDTAWGIKPRTTTTTQAPTTTLEATTTPEPTTFSVTTDTPATKGGRINLFVPPTPSRTIK